jgi:poly(A) polymerase
MLVVVNGISYDVATFRTDGGYQDGRHPESISYDTAEHDAQRRDFTVNALFYDPITHQVIDYVGGVADLEAGILRTVGDPLTRFREDRLRLLRAIRFAAVCGWQIEANTWKAICAEAPYLGCVSMERIRAEFLRMLCEAPSPTQALELLRTSGLLQVFFPEFVALHGCLQDPIWHPEGDVWQHTVKMLEMLPTKRDATLVWAVLLHDIGKPASLVVDVKPDGSPWYRTPGHAAVGARMAEPILRRFKESLATLEAVCTAVRQHMQFVELPKMREATMRKMLGRPTIALELELHRLDCLSSHAKLDLYDLAKERLAAYAGEAVLPPPALTGKDLIALGFAPGPRMGSRLKEAYTQQLEGATREALLAQALLAAPGHSNRALRVAFIVGERGSIPLVQAWEARTQRDDWEVALVVMPGVPWEAPLPTAAQLYRIVTDCAGNPDYPPSKQFDVCVCDAADFKDEMRAMARQVILV